MDFNILKEKIEAASKKAFTELYNKHKDEGIYCFALYSDDGAMTVCPSTNTIDFLDNLDEEQKQDLAYYKFEPAEWTFEMIGADKEFDDICSELRNELDKINCDNEETTKAFMNFRKDLFDACISVLKTLKEENFFSHLTGNDVFLMFTVSDYEFDKKELKKIVVTLNDKHYQDEYLAWMKTW